MKALVLVLTMFGSMPALAASYTVKCNQPVTLEGYEKEACIQSAFKSEVTYLRCDDGFLAFNEKEQCAEAEESGKLSESGLLILRAK